MKRVLTLAMSLVLLAGCGGTPVPTQPPPTQTPWIVVVTSTAASQEISEVQPTAPIQPTVTPRATTTRAPATATAGVTATTGATATRMAATATQAPATGAMLYAPPVLLEPPERQPVSWKSTVLLEWSSVGKLKEDEYYHLHLERRPRTAGQDWYGDYAFTKETQFRAEGAFLAPFHPSVEHGEATVYWWVRVVQETGQDEKGKPIGVDISPYSEERTLILEPKP